MFSLFVITALCAPLRYAEDRAPAIVNPLFATSMSEARLNELVFEGLYTDDQALQSVGQLAKSQKLADDMLSMEITLRGDVKWHDGSLFDAEDVAFTIAAMQSEETASTEAGRAGWIKKVEVLEPHKVRLEFEAPEYAPQDKLHFKILPAHLFDAPEGIQRSHPFRMRPTGTGPFILEMFNEDNSISLSPNQDHYERVGLDGITMREVADKNYQAKLLIYESLEALVRVLPRDLATLQNDSKVELYPYQTNSWWYVGFNLAREPYQDPNLREALRHMVDTESLLKPIGTGDLLSGPFVKSSPFYNHDVELPKRDPERAQTLLQRSGYQLVGQQWMKDGNPLTIRVATLSNLETAQDVVINMQSQLQQQGIVVEPEFLGNAEWKERVWRDRDYDVILSQWSFDRNEDVYEQFHTNGVRNFSGYSNGAVDEKLDAARVAQDPQEKKALLREVHSLIANDAPMIFLWTLDSYSALSTKVSGVVVHPFYFFTWAEDWKL